MQLKLNMLMPPGFFESIALLAPFLGFLGPPIPQSVFDLFEKQNKEDPFKRVKINWPGPFPPAYNMQFLNDPLN